MAAEEQFEQIRDMLKAYYPVLYLSTFEYDRVKQKLREVAKSLDKGYKFFTWNSVDGLSRTDLLTKEEHRIEDMEEPEEVLKFVLSEFDSERDSCEIFVLEDFHEYIEERAIKVRLRQLSEKLRRCRKHVVIVSPVLRLPVELEKYVAVVEFALPGSDDLGCVFDNVAKDCDSAVNAESRKKLIDSALGMTAMEAELAYCLAAVKDRLGKNSPQIVSREKEQIIKKSGLLDFFQANEDLKSVGGMEYLKEWLEKRKCAYDFKAQKWGLQEPKGLLLLGVPGCGKSLTAKCVAALWNMPLLRLDIGKVFQGLVGSSEENIRRAIATAEAVAPCVLWIDEIEKGLSGVKSSGATDGGTGARIFSTILTWMQEKTKPVFVVATANDISALPPELLRKGRFDEIFFVDLPNPKDRESIWKIHLGKMKKDADKYFPAKLAEESKGFNGAEIEECVKEAMFTAYAESPDEPELKMKHLLDAIKGIVPLARTMPEQIRFLRDWSKTRAKQAGSPNEEKIEEKPDEKIVRTKTEKEAGRNFE